MIGMFTQRTFRSDTPSLIRKCVSKRMRCYDLRWNHRSSLATTTTTRGVAVVAAASPDDEPGRKKVVVVHSSLAQQQQDKGGGSCVDYVRGWAWQQLLLNRRLARRRRRTEKEEQQEQQQQTSAEYDDDDDDDDDLDPDLVLLLQHNPVYTLGRGANENHLTFLGCDNNNINKGSDDDDDDDQAYKEEARQRLARSSRGLGSARLSMDQKFLIQGDHLLLHRTCELEKAVEELCKITMIMARSRPVLAPNGAEIWRVERGGEVTFHGPGQLVVYPLFDLKRHKPDLHWFLRMVEEVIIQTLSEFNIEGYRDDINTGVWVNEKKIAAVGVSSSRWITTHGFALNICPDLKFFDTSVILPCGIEGRGVTSIDEILRERGETTTPTVPEVAGVVLEKMSDIFEIELESGQDIV